MDFPTDISTIEKRIKDIDPIAYSKNRNYINGSVTHLSPYITHGVVSLPHVRDTVLKKYSVKDSYVLIFELAWREFFQRTWEVKQDAIFSSLRHTQEGLMTHQGLPKSYIQKETTINAIDTALRDLEYNGYVHNHARMWLAMLVVTIAKHAWWEGAKHLYYHLLDGDRASNTLSWQWVAGTFSSKQYIANQEMINKFALTKQDSTYLDFPIETLRSKEVPLELTETIPLNLPLDDAPLSNVSMEKQEILKSETWLYSMWTLDPKWQPTTNTTTQKILFIDADDLKQFPMSPKRISFVLKLAYNIPNIKIFYGHENDIFNSLTNNPLYRKYHPAITQWPGTQTPPEYLFPQVNSIPNGFMSFWKKCEPYL